MSRILFIDPGSKITGFAYRTGQGMASGVLKGKASARNFERILEIKAKFVALVQEIDPTKVVLEVPGNKAYARNRGQTAHKNLGAIAVLGYATGMIACTALEIGLEVETVEAHEWKQGQKKGEAIASACAILGTNLQCKDAGYNCHVKCKKIDDNRADAICLCNWYRLHGGIL